MALTEFWNKQVEIPLKVEIPLSDIGDFIKNQKDSLISTIKTHYKNYKDAANAQEAIRSQPPIKPPDDGPRYPATSANRPSAATMQGYKGYCGNNQKPSTQPIPIIDQYEIPLARNEDFVQIHPYPACSGTCYVGFERGNQIGQGIFKDIAGRSMKRMAPPDPAMLDRANDLLESTEEVGTHKLPANHSDIPPNFSMADQNFKEILDILYRNRRL